MQTQKATLRDENWEIGPFRPKHLRGVISEFRYHHTKSPIMSINTSSDDCENGSTDKAGQSALSQESHEWPGTPVFRASPALPASRASLGLPESLVSLVSPVSPVCPASPAFERQAIESDIEQELKKLAACNACTARKGAKTRRFRLARELATIQMREGRKLAPSEVMTACREWFELSRRFLEPKATFEEHLAALIAEMGKALVPTGEGALARARAKVAKLSVSDLPAIPDWPVAPETWRRLAAIHRELSAANGGNTHFLSYRNAARAIGVSPQQAHDITLTLEAFGVIKIVDKGQAGPGSQKAAEFLYLLGWQDGPLDL